MCLRLLPTHCYVVRLLTVCQLGPTLALGASPILSAHPRYETRRGCYRGKGGGGAAGKWCVRVGVEGGAGRGGVSYWCVDRVHYNCRVLRASFLSVCRALTG